MSQLTPYTKKINDTTYEVRMLSPKVATRMAAEVAKVLGPVLGVALGSSDGKEESALDRKVDFAGALRVAAEKLDPDMLERHMDILTEVSFIDGKPMKQIGELHFTGKLLERFQWYAFAMEVNFLDFFNAGKRAFGALPVPGLKAL